MYKNTGIEHYKTRAAANNTQVAAGSTDQVGFVMIYAVSKESDIIIDSGPTISLFKDAGYVTNLEKAANRLVMETNAGSKVVEQKGTIPGYGQVWYNGDAIYIFLVLVICSRKAIRLY